MRTRTWPGARGAAFILIIYLCFAGTLVKPGRLHADTGNSTEVASLDSRMPKVKNVKVPAPRKKYPDACVTLGGVDKGFGLRNLDPEDAAPVVAERGWDPLLDRLEQDGFDRDMLTGLFGRDGLEYDPKPMRTKMRTLFGSAFGERKLRTIQELLIRAGYTLESADGIYGNQTATAISGFQKICGLRVDGTPSPELLHELKQAKLPRAEKTKPSPGRMVSYKGPGPVYKSIMSPTRLAEAREFYIENRDLLRGMEERFGVPQEIAVGILTVETRVGKYLGADKALVTLASMALCKDYELVKPFFQGKSLTMEQEAWLVERSSQKADWAYAEVAALLKYCKQNDLDPLSLPGSIYGAIGISQFMPTSVLRFGADGDGDGDVDLFTPEDAVHSLGNYISKHGWKGEMKERKARHRVLYQYNHSDKYVNTVLAVAEHIDQGSVNATAPEGAKTVAVENVAQFLQAVAPDTIIVLEPGTYVLEKPEGADVPDNPHIQWVGASDGKGEHLLITGVENLLISGKDGVVLRGAYPEQPALAFENCKGLILDHLAVGGADGRAQGASPGLSFTECEKVWVQDCLLEKSGIGLAALRVKGLTVVNTAVKNCSRGMLSLDGCKKVYLGNCLFKGNRKAEPVTIRRSSVVEFVQCVMQGNAVNQDASCFMSIDKGSEKVVLRDSFVAGNRAKEFANDLKRIAVQETEFKDNQFRVKLN